MDPTDLEKALDLLQGGIAEPSPEREKKMEELRLFFHGLQADNKEGQLTFSQEELRNSEEGQSNDP